MGTMKCSNGGNLTIAKTPTCWFFSAGRRGVKRQWLSLSNEAAEALFGVLLMHRDNTKPANAHRLPEWQNTSIGHPVDDKKP